MGFTKRDVRDDDFRYQRFQLTNVSTGVALGTFDFTRILDASDTIGTALNRAFQMEIENFLDDEVDPAINTTLPNHIADNVRHTSAAERTLFADKPSNATFNNAISAVNGNIATTNTNLSNHIADNTRHITGAERSAWNDKPSNATFNSSVAAKAPTASPAFTGTPTAPTGTDYGTSRIRNIYAGTADMTPGTTALASGNIYLMYE